MNQITPLKQLTQSVEKLKPNLLAVLPQGMDADRFIKKANAAIATHPQRDKLEQADRTSLFSAIQQSAQDGLELDGREATLVCFFDKKKGAQTAQYIPMTQGLVKLARNSGEIQSIQSEVVHENDDFTLYYDQDGMHFKHEPAWKDRGDPVLVWASVKLKDGGVIARALSSERVMKIGSGGANGYQYDPKKGAHWEEWWRKTAIKNVLKYAPKSTELERTIERENEQYNDEPIDITETTKKEKPANRQTKAAKVIEDAVLDEPKSDEPQLHDEVIDIEVEDDLAI